MSKKILMKPADLLANKKYFIRLLQSKSAATDKPTKQKSIVQISNDIQSDFLAGKFKAKYHPGVMSVNCVTLPAPLLDSLHNVEKKFDKNLLAKDAAKLSSYIWDRHTPAEGYKLQEKINSIAKTLIEKGKLSAEAMEDGKIISNKLTDSEKKKLETSMKNHIYNWKPLQFTPYTSFVYLWARLAPDYAALVRIFSEIKKRVSDFHPNTLFDFGSGVGSVAWAVDSVWPELCKEAYYVDASAEMNDLSQLLLKGGTSGGSSLVRPNTTYVRQFLPSADTLKYNLVVSSRCMFELGDLANRVKTIDILWRKVAPGGFLVLVECGSNAAYTTLLEARDYLLEMNEIEKTKYMGNTDIHVFAPCPHDQFCPRFVHKSLTSCHFSVTYDPIETSGNAYHEIFSYVVLQKQERNRMYEWPRIVQPVLCRHKHVICRACTPSAELKEVLVTKSKHGNTCYQLCRKSRWGDLIPGTIEGIGDGETNESNNNYPGTSSMENDEERELTKENVAPLKDFN